MRLGQRLILATALAIALVTDAAHINRAVATFRYVAGLPTDAEPPAASN